MYEQTFQFSSRPFNSVPRLEDFFAGLSHQQAIDVAHMCVDRSTGPVVVVGSVGMGKSLLLQKLGQSFESRFDVVHIECSRLEERSELLQSILFELNLPYAGLSEGELRLSLMGYLKENKGAADGVLLLVDEADRLSVELIDELRLITNQIRDGRSLVQLVLAGTQRLEDSLTDAKLASFNQRIAARCVLQSFSKEETRQFIYQHIEHAGRAGDEIFNDEAIDEVHQKTSGVPRLINQLCDQSLLLAASREQQPVDRSLICEAWAEMQNMPIAAVDTGSMAAGGCGDSGSVVEFGQLGDHEGASECADDQTNVEGEDPFAAQPAEEVCCGEEAACDAEEAVCDGEEVACDAAGEAEAEDNGQAEDEPHDEIAAEGDEEVADPVPADSSPLGLHASAAALAATAFAATAVGSDPFAPQEENQLLEDGNTESERIASLEQEQEELLEQTRGHDETGSDEVRSAFEVLGLSEQGVEPPEVDDMIPADPFQIPEDASNSAVADEDTSPTVEAVEAEQTEEAVGACEEDSECTEELSPMAQCSIEEQLGLVEPTATEPSSFHTPPFEPRPYVESESLQNQGEDLTQDEAVPAAESTDPFAEPFEEEEMLQDAYSPFVAEQNQASLEVTSDQLSHLTPLDAVDDASDDTGLDHWNSQTPELAIEELDATGVSTDAAPADVEAIGEGDFVSNDGLQAADDFSPTHSSVPPSDVWQNNKETAWDPSQYQVPSEVESETPASFQAIPSVPTELSPISPSSEQLPQENSAFDEDPFAPKEDQEPAQSETIHPQSQGPQPTDEDLEALTSDLGSATMFDLGSQQNTAASGFVDSQDPSAGQTGGMMDLNDLVPGHMLQQMEAANADQNSPASPEEGVAGGAEVTGEAYTPEVPVDYARDSFAVPDQTAGLAAPYSAHASIDNAETPEAAAQAEARRKTEEFMRTFNAQRDVQAADDSDQVQPFEQPVAAEEVGEHPEEKSQEILKEIFSQQQILDQVHFTEPPVSTLDQSDAGDPESALSHDGQGADSYSVETPVTGFQNYQQPGEPPAVQDDRDMLYVNETQQYTPPQAAEPPQPPPFPNVQTSTGNAERMDYNQLFDQLRNASPEQ